MKNISELWTFEFISLKQNVLSSIYYKKNINYVYFIFSKFGKYILNNEICILLALLSIQWIKILHNPFIRTITYFVFTMNIFTFLENIGWADTCFVFSMFENPSLRLYRISFCNKVAFWLFKFRGIGINIGIKLKTCLFHLL